MKSSNSRKTTPPEEYVVLRQKSGSNRIVINGKSGREYTFSGIVPISVLASDAPDLLAFHTVRRPCCNGVEYTIYYFEEVTKE